MKLKHLKSDDDFIEKICISLSIFFMLICFYSSGKDKKLDMFKIILKYNSFQEKKFMKFIYPQQPNQMLYIFLNHFQHFAF